MRFVLNQKTVKIALYQHLKDLMTDDERTKYNQGEAKISVQFHHLKDPKLVLEIIEREN